MLGARDINLCHLKSFGKGWFADAVSHLKLLDTVTVNEHTADYGDLPDLSKINEMLLHFCYFIFPFNFKYTIKSFATLKFPSKLTLQTAQSLFFSRINRFIAHASQK